MDESQNSTTKIIIFPAHKKHMTIRLYNTLPRTPVKRDTKGILVAPLRNYGRPENTSAAYKRLPFSAAYKRGGSTYFYI